VLDAMAAAPAPTVVVTGDIHASAAGPLRALATDPDSPVVGAEFVGTSISSSNGDVGALLDDVFGPAFEYFQSERRGYVRTEFTADLATTDYVVVDDARDPDSTVRVDATFTVDRDRALTRV
jgi:alkaline phosphatase D